MFTSTTVQQVIDRARIRHWSFRDLVLGDGAVLFYLSQRLRTHLAMHGASIEGLVNETLEYNISTANGTLVAVDPTTGIPQLATTFQDGWSVHIDPNTNIPYIDTSEPPVAGDPYGANGGTPGFPLPAEMVRLCDVSLIYSNPPGLNLPCDVIPERGRLYAMPGRNPQAFVSGNRLVPLFPLQGATANSADRWFNVTSIIMSYVGLPTLALLTDPLNIPGVLVEALDADAALMMARQSKDCSAADKSGFERDAAAAASAVSAAGLEILNDDERESVEYRD